MSVDVLPDSRARIRKGGIRIQGVNYVPIYCINCGRRYGLVPEIDSRNDLSDELCCGKRDGAAQVPNDGVQITVQELP